MGKREWQDGQIRAECVLRPAAAVILATSACFWKSVGQNANECVLPRAVHGLPSPTFRVKFLVDGMAIGRAAERGASRGDEGLPMHALVGKMTNSFWKSRIRSKNDHPSRQPGTEATGSARGGRTGVEAPAYGAPRHTPGRPIGRQCGITGGRPLPPRLHSGGINGSKIAAHHTRGELSRHQNRDYRRPHPTGDL